jgi:hypothetical protein
MNIIRALGFVMSFSAGTNLRVHLNISGTGFEAWIYGATPYIANIDAQSSPFVSSS